MAHKRKRNESEAPPAPEEEDELEEEGEVDPGTGGGAARLKLEAKRKRKREHMQRKRARDGEAEKAKSKLAMRNFRSGLSGKAKADYLVRQNQYKAAYRQRKTEGAGPAPRGRRIEDDPEQEDEPEDEGAEESPPPPPPPPRTRSRALRNTKDEDKPEDEGAKERYSATAPPPRTRSRAPKNTNSVAPSSQAKPPPKGAPKKSGPQKRISAAAPSTAGRKRKRTDSDADLDPPAVESEEEQEVQARRPKKRPNVPAKRKAPAEGEMPDDPTTEEETGDHAPPPLSMSLRRPPAPPPTPPSPASPASSAPKPTKARKYHTVRCARGSRCRMGLSGRIPVEKMRAKYFSWSKWIPKYGNHFVTAQGEPVDEATFNKASVNLCSVDLVYYRYKYIEKGSAPGFLDDYLTEDEEPQEGEQSTVGIDLDTTEVQALFDPQMPFGLEQEEHKEPSEGFFDPDEPSTPTLFGPRGMEGKEEESAEGVFDPDEPLPFLPSSPSPTLFGLRGMEDEDEESAEGLFDPDEPPRALSPPKPFDSIIPTLASRAATPTLGDINRGPSRSPSPFPVSPERNALTPPEHNAPAPPEHNAPAPLEQKAPAPPEHNTPLVDYGSPAEVLDYGTPEEELEDGGEDEEAEAARLAKLRQNVHVAALQAYRASSQYDQRFDPLLYNPTAPTNLDTYDPNAGKERSTVEILQIKKEIAEGFEEGASGVVSAPSSAIEPLPEGWWDLAQMPWTEKDHAEREQKAKDGTWRRAFNSGTFFVTGVHVSRRDARAAARLLK
ncbi:hypothetical protein B0H16DRAFT_1809778 [Mycena metata]|uniref:Uncharacterized protein n=1 Tax=Mycena metata TaxID=1033252 RepID=A0AAD7JCR2_9AGAR|nr:hypothetical protein B0H16DRAFT_1809778 [Mycena metata]